MSERKSATKRAREAAAPLETDPGMPMTVGIRELRDHLSRYLALVKTGVAVTVTEHGRVIATIMPMQFEERTLELYREGKVTLPTLPPGDPTDWPRIHVEGGMQDILREVRGD